MKHKLLWSLPTIIVFGTIHHGLTKLYKRGQLVTTAENLLVVYLAVLMTVTLDLDAIWVSIRYGWPLPRIPWFAGGINLVLFAGVRSFRAIGMLLENALLFLPFGFLLPCASNRKNCWFTIFVGFALSIAIELIQPVIGRIFDVNDLAMNTLGAFIGWSLWWMCHRTLYAKRQN